MYQLYKDHICNMRNLLFASMLTMIFGMESCINAPDFPDEPVLTYSGLSRSTMTQGSANEDSIRIFFSFTDGDGDIGIAPEDKIESAFDVIVTDTRNGTILDRFFAPYVPPKGASNGIQGTGEILIFTTCCIYEDGTVPCEPNPEQPSNEMVLEVYMRDRAGNESNRILTEAINLQCL